MLIPSFRNRRCTLTYVEISHEKSVSLVLYDMVGDCLRDPLAAKEALEADLGDMQALCLCDFRCCKKMSGAYVASPAYEN